MADRQAGSNPLAAAAAVAGKLATGDFGARLATDSANPSLDALAASLAAVGEALAAGRAWRQSTEQRLAEVVEVITAVAGLDFSRRATVGEGSEAMDAVAAGLNMLQEELQHSTVSRAYLDSIMRSMVDPLVVADITGRIQSADAARIL